MRNLRLICVLSVALLSAKVAAQSASRDISSIGPKVGAVAPAFSGTDQNGRIVSLASAAGPKGTMLVFFRSADW